MSAAARSASAAAHPAPGPERPARSRRWLPWSGVALAALALFTVFSWPLAANPGGLWSMVGNDTTAGQWQFYDRAGAMSGGDQLQNIFIDSVIVDNARELREPYLDLREGAAGPSPLRTTSLNLPWTPVVGLLWPLTGLVPAYNATLALSTVATALAAFGLLRRHTRWPLLAMAGALVYAASPHRMYQLSVHFNAVMWWAFPAAAWAFDAALTRHRAGRSWWRPALALAAVVAVVGVSGEYHLALYMAGLLGFLAVWAVGAALVARRGGEPRPVPLGPAVVALVSVVTASGYVLAAFGYVFRGSVGGGNGRWEEVVLYAPDSLRALVTKDFGESGEGMVYLGAIVLLLALAGLVTAVTRGGRPSLLPWAVLTLPLFVLTFGPTLKAGPVDVYRWVFDHVPFLELQRVPQRLMVVTALVVVLLAVAGADRLARAALPGRRAGKLAAAGLVVVTLLVLADYRISDNRISDARTGNDVMTALRAAGDEAGPILGVPVSNQTTTWTSVHTYTGAITRRRTLNAYNQTPAPWLGERLARLEPLNRGIADPSALEVLRETGTRQVLVVDEPHIFRPGEYDATVRALAASGRFRVAVADGPMTLLDVTG